MKTKEQPNTEDREAIVHIDALISYVDSREGDCPALEHLLDLRAEIGRCIENLWPSPLDESIREAIDAAAAQGKS
jgi:hypothetical protein